MNPSDLLPNADRTIPASADEEVWKLMMSLLYMSVVGGITSFVLYMLNLAYAKIRMQLTCSITLQSSDDIYKMVLDFLTMNNYL